MAVYGYVRVSTEKQASEGDGLAVQMQQIQKHCEAQGLTLSAVFVESGVSGSVPFADRPEGRKLLATTQKGDTIIATKLDRMFRSTKDCLNVRDELVAHGVHIKMLDIGVDICDDLTGLVVLTAMAMMANFERNRIRERIKQSKQFCKEKGRYLGGRKPFGWDVGEDGQLVENAAEQAALAMIREMKAQGQSLRRISAHVQQATGCYLSTFSLSRMGSYPPL